MGGGPHLPTHSNPTADSDHDLSTLHAWVRNTILSIAKHVTRLSTRKWDAAAWQSGEDDEGEGAVVRDWGALVRGVEYAHRAVYEEDGIEMQYSEPNQRGDISVYFNRPPPNEPLTVGIPLHILRLNPWSPSFLSQLEKLAAGHNAVLSHCEVSSSTRERLPGGPPIAEDFLEAGQIVYRVGESLKLPLPTDLLVEPKEVNMAENVDVSTGLNCKHCEEKVKTVEMLEFAKSDLQEELRVKDQRLEMMRRKLRAMEREQLAWEECGESEEEAGEILSQTERNGERGAENMQPRKLIREQTMKAKNEELKAREKNMKETNQELKARVEKLKEHNQAFEARKQGVQAKEKKMQNSDINAVVGVEASEGPLHAEDTIVKLKVEENRSERQQGVGIDWYSGMKGLRGC